MMNNFMESRIFLKIISLVLAIGLYVVLGINQETKTIKSLLPSEIVQKETITGIPVTVNGNKHEYVIQGIPKTVDVTFKGVGSQVKAVINKQEYEVIANVMGISEGMYHVKFQVKNIPKEVIATVNPKQVTATIEKIISK